MAIYIDPQLSADDLRDELFAGHLVLLTGLPAVLDLVAHTREQLAALFAPHHPEHAHDHYTPDELARALGTWKPSFIHGQRSGELVRAVIAQAGFAPEDTYFDLPKPRTSFPQGHLTTGAAFAFPWHRDQWYAAPAQQINWWLPIFPLQKDNAMSFDLAHFARPVANDSHLFDSYQNNVARLTTAAQVTHEVQVRPHAVDHHAGEELIVLPSPGAILLFSGAHLHRTIPNTSGRARFSIDFRTVDASDLLGNRGAPIPDAHCTGTSIRDFRNIADGSGFDERTVEELFGPTPPGAMVVFGPDDAASVGVADGTRVAERK
jgi:hypothetical protein